MHLIRKTVIVLTALILNLVRVWCGADPPLYHGTLTIGLVDSCGHILCKTTIGQLCNQNPRFRCCKKHVDSNYGFEWEIRHA